MQLTADLIRQYSHTRKGQALGQRLRKKIRQRARNGDTLARAFFAYSFKGGTMAEIQQELGRFFGDHF